MLNWNSPTRRPRHFAGEISAIYMGPSTDDPPMPSPAKNRNTTRDDQLHARAQPSDDTRYRTARPRRLSRRPYLSPKNPAVAAPMIVPHSALETVKPSAPGERPYVVLNARVVPAITAVSKPNSRPPSAATIVLFSRVRLSFRGV